MTREEYNRLESVGGFVVIKFENKYHEMDPIKENFKDSYTNWLSDGCYLN